MKHLKALISVLAFSFACETVRAQECVSATKVAESVVSISRYFVDELSQESMPQGSAIFIAQSELLSVGHLVRGLQLTHDEWSWVTIMQERLDGYYTITMRARIKQSFAENLPVEDGLHILELDREYPGSVRIAWLRMTPLVDGEPTIAVGYSGGERAFAWGTYVEKAPRLAYYAYGGPDFQGFELADGLDRYAIYPGASGGPITDCSGAVVGLISRVSTREPTPGIVLLLYQEAGVPVMRGHANVWGVPTLPVAEQILTRGY